MTALEVVGQAITLALMTGGVGWWVWSLVYHQERKPDL